jgi:hypothetical protein
MSETSANSEEHLRIDGLVKLKYALEKESWTKKIFLKFVEALLLLVYFCVLIHWVLKFV